MSNPNDNCLAGMRCPKCGSYGPFEIEATVPFVVTDDGAEPKDANVPWDYRSPCSCSCGHHDNVGGFTEDS
jgi:hypothetical protein